MSAYVASYEPDAKRSFTGVAVVFILHAIVIYALVTGLAHKVIDSIKSPLDATLIEEKKIEEPPKPKEIVPPPPKLEAPPPAFVPPPEVVVNQAPPAEPPIQAVVETPPPRPVEITPTPVAPPPPAPVAPPKPQKVSVGVACPKRAEVNRPTQFDGIAGEVKVRITVSDSKVSGIDILSSKPKGMFDGAVRESLAKWGCSTGPGETVIAETIFNFTAD